MSTRLRALCFLQISLACIYLLAVSCFVTILHFLVCLWTQDDARLIRIVDEPTHLEETA